MKHIFDSKKIFVFDGAMGTMLQKFGMKTGSSAEELNLTHPEIILEIHKKYIEAGSDIIQSNTFGGNVFRLKHYGLEKKIGEINKRGIELARKSSNKNILIAASIGPTGAILYPYGEISHEEVFESFYNQMKFCDEADFLNIETMQSITEAELAIKAAKEILKDKPVSVSLTYQKNSQGYATIWGEDISKTVQVLEEISADVIGSNCGDGFEQFVEIMELLSQKTKLPLSAKPNAGIPVIKENRIIYPETPEMIIDKVERLIEIGIKIIGGCCGTTPDHIKAIRKTVDKYLIK